MSDLPKEANTEMTDEQSVKLKDLTFSSSHFLPHKLLCGVLQVISVIISAVARNGAGGFNFKSVISFSKIPNFTYHLWNLKLFIHSV